MRESGESSRKPRRSGFSLFRRSRRAARPQELGNTSTLQSSPNRNWTQAKSTSAKSTNLTSVRGDLCQLGDSAPAARSAKFSSKGLKAALGWLFKNNQRNQKSGKQHQSSESQLGSGQSLRGVQGMSRFESSRISRIQSNGAQSSGASGNTEGRTGLNARRPGSSQIGQFVPISERRTKRQFSKDGFSSNRPSQLSPSMNGAADQSRAKNGGNTQATGNGRSLIPFPRSAKSDIQKNGRHSKFGNSKLGNSKLGNSKLGNSKLGLFGIGANRPTVLQSPTELQQGTVLQPLEESHNRRSRRKRVPKAAEQPKSRSMAIALYAARMLILSVGVGVLAGTVLSAWNPANNPFLTDAPSAIKQASSTPLKTTTSAGQLQLGQELAPLKASIQKLLPQYKGMSSGTFLIDLDSGNYVDLDGSNNFSAASTIKVPVLVAFFQDVDAGRIRLDEKLTVRKDLIGGGSGELQGYPVGTQFTALDVVTKMITISDNTATNMLIDRLGGISALSQRFKSWGLSSTTISNLLPDLQGTNMTSPKELASLLVRVGQGELVSLKSRDRMLDIMRRTINNSQLPQGLGEGAMIAHKTGDIGKLIGDVGLVDMPNGKRYAIAVLVKCPFNDTRAYDLVQKVSRLTYQHLSGGTGAPVKSSPVSASASTDSETQASPDAQHIPDTAPITPDHAPGQ
jgi:beta-lactamase class A